jgi:hypothetical protein
MAKFDSIEYSVCEDCLLITANGEASPDCKDDTLMDYESAVEHEVAGRNAYFCVGVDPTDDDPEGDGYDEFSWHACELCGSTLGGSRHGMTLLITLEDA